MAASTLFFAEALLPAGWARGVRIDITDGCITEITVDAEPAGERHGVGLPGLPNLHSHAFQRGMAALAEVRGTAEDSFWSWREVMYRFLGALTADDVEAIAALAYAEMLEAGFTRVAEFHYLHHQPDGRAYADPGEMAGRVIAAAEATGIGLTLLPVLYAHGNFGGAAATPGQRRFINSTDGYAALIERARTQLAPLPDAVLGTAPHSLRAVTPEQLAHAVGLAEGGPVHIHAAEQMREVEDCLAWSGARPVQWLLEHGLGAGWCVVHATHMTAAETAGLAHSGAVAGLCPITEASLGDGIFEGVGYLAAGGRYGIGTDSNIQITAAGELRQLEYSQRLTTRRRNVLAGAGATTGRSLFAAALAGGAAALGTTAGIAVGVSADLVALETTHPSLIGRSGDGWLDGWIFASAAGADTVWRRGRKVVQHGRHFARERIERDYRRTLNRLMSL